MKEIIDKRLIEITNIMDVLEQVYHHPTRPSSNLIVNDRWMNLLGEMDTLTELHRLLYNYEEP